MPRHLGLRTRAEPWTSVRGKMNGKNTLDPLHMPDIEQTCLLPRPVMRLGDAQITVLDRHRISSKRHELCSILGVKVVQSRLLYLFGGGRRKSDWCSGNCDSLGWSAMPKYGERTGVERVYGGIGPQTAGSC